MKPLLVPLLALLLVASFAPAAFAGLYDDEGKDATSGDLNNQDYWWAKYDAMMLELAIKQHQPEGRIAVDLASSIRRLNDLEKQFPKHEGIKNWKQRATEVDKKINPDANRHEYFNPNCPWDEANFAQAWVNYHHGKMQYAAKDYEHALGLFQNVKLNFKILLVPDRMKEYPENLRKWVEEHRDDVDKTYAELKEKTHN
jgi:hypothetical protein